MSFGLDSSLKIWDVRPFAISNGNSDNEGSRLSKTLTGSIVGAEQILIQANWSRSADRIVAGSGDRTCVIWDVETGKILYKLPGHRGTCTAADYHPREPIVVSASTDGTLFLGEIEP